MLVRLPESSFWDAFLRRPEIEEKYRLLGIVADRDAVEANLLPLAYLLYPDDEKRAKDLFDLTAKQDFDEAVRWLLFLNRAYQAGMRGEDMMRMLEALHTQEEDFETLLRPLSDGAWPISASSGWSATRVFDTLTKVKEEIGWPDTAGSARKWWEAFEKENSHRMSLVLRLAEEIRNRRATITDFFLAYVYSNTDNIQANLHYLDYTRLKRFAEKKEPSTYPVLPPERQDLPRYVGDALLAEIANLESRCDWENTTGSARKWWEAFRDENRKKPEPVYRLIAELVARQATITEFFLAYVYSNTDNIKANLCYLDYTRLKKEEEKKRRKAAARVASAPVADPVSLDEEEE